jgi:hypothetical protein
MVRNCILLLILSINTAFGQYPWNNPLMVAKSTDGITFSTPTIFQDSSGVPCIIRWHGDTLISSFQWFRSPVGAPSWDRVAVKFSYDKGLTWTEPVPIQIPDMPATYQRPFDPTLVVTDTNKIRIFFSSGITSSMMLDSQINTYSAISTDGIHYSFEAGPRYDHATTRAIDPAVVYFHGMWHYLSPYGPPNIAYHAISADGFHFSAVPDIMGDMAHNWTGNYVVNDTGELRFYGCGGSTIWYNHSANGGAWDGYVNTNIKGGDPAVVKVETGNYLMVYTGQPYALGIARNARLADVAVYPNPCSNTVSIKAGVPLCTPCTIYVTGADGKRNMLRQEYTADEHAIKLDVKALPPGSYNLHIENATGRYTSKIIKEN